jgi:hypothetical protein
MKPFLPLLFLVLTPLALAQEEAFDKIEPAVNLPKEYSDYLIAPATISRDKSYAVLIPKTDLCGENREAASRTADRCKDYFVRLDPFELLTTLDTEWPEFESKSNGGISADWQQDGSATLITLESKWGPGDIFLVEMANGKAARTTNLLAKAHDLLLPDYEKAKAAKYNDKVDFVFLTEADGGICEFVDATHVRITGTATNEPKSSGGEKIWKARVEAVWDIPSAKFVSEKVTPKDSGKKKVR